MNEKHFSPQFEESVRQSFGVPEIRTEFVRQAYADLMQRAAAMPRQARPSSKWKPAWGVALAVLSILVIGILAVGPQRVIAAVGRMFGYIPEVGIVEQGAPIRVLAEPVSLTRDGITVEIKAATLTSDQTHVEVGIFGVPATAYPDREDVLGCIERPYLLLSDGSRLEVEAPVPANINAATYVMPCIFNTLPGTVPTGWELVLKFVAAPPDMTVLAVIELSPSPETNLAQNTVAPSEEPTSIVAVPEDHAVAVSKEIETEDGYILVGSFQPKAQPGERIEVTGISLKDASGKEIPYTRPLDVAPDAQSMYAGGSGWAMQFKGYGLAYPLIITFTGVPVREADPNSTAEFTFDAGANPQPGQEWDLNQEFELAGYTLKLVSITANSRGGYSFRFYSDKVYGADVQITGFTPNGGGGGGVGGLTDGVFSRSLSYSQLPTGILTVNVSHLTVIGDPFTWQGQWTPANPRTNFPTPQPGVCLSNSVSLDGLSPLPPEPAGGKALVYEQLEGSDQWRLVLYRLDGSSKQVVAAGAAWGALSPDGSQVAYSPFSNTPVDIHIFDLNTQTVRTLPGVSGTGYHWSPDGRQIAYIASGNGIFVVDADGANNRQISALSNATILGWSADGLRLYFGVPYTGGTPWKVFVLDLASGVTTELFNIENGTPKFLNPKLSPDGNWIAYRGKDNSSLYLVRPDGSDMHLVLDALGAVGIEWTRSSWLGVSLKDPTSAESVLVFIKPDGCETYQMPVSVQGDLQGLFIP